MQNAQCAIMNYELCIVYLTSWITSISLPMGGGTTV